MFELKRFLIILTSTLLAIFSSKTVYASTSAVDVVCRGGIIDNRVLQSLYRLGDQLRAKSTILNLTPNCIKEIKFPDRDPLPNPYVGALELAAGKSTPEKFANSLEKIQGHLSGNDPIDRDLKDAPLLMYLRIGCGNDRVCVTNTLKSIQNFQPEKSPIFCDFANKADSRIVNYYQSSDYLPLPVRCLYHSSLGGHRSISALEDWFIAFDKLSR